MKPNFAATAGGVSSSCSALKAALARGRNFVHWRGENRTSLIVMATQQVHTPYVRPQVPLTLRDLNWRNPSSRHCAATSHSP